MSTGPSREETLFSDALAQPAAGRDAFVDRECGADVQLRQRVRALLAAHNEAESLLCPTAAATPDGWEELFAAALAQPEARRAELLGQACGDDAALRERVLALLRAHAQAGSLRGASPASEAGVHEEPGGESISHGRAQPPPETLPGAATEFTGSPREENAGDTIGRYRLLERIGEGGCGVVWLAEQEEPVHRRVALKVIKLGMDTKAVIARFEAERQALAMMDHPNIAKVFDAGTNALGRPYFVMELVHGVPITAFCDERNLPTAARLQLFIKVCLAVQHAHQKGVIHRDIKPSNILVALHDDTPTPKVIDFGIAKATGGRLTAETIFTAVEQFMGTPAYMSPEQAQVSMIDIDTRSDIYSLGVLLYELLTGRTPFDAAQLLKAGLDEMRRHIREVDPPRPSTRLSTMQGEALTKAAKRRQIAPPKLLSLVRGDLDWIVMRCLEKDRTRRYDTATALANDIQRHLAHEPVIAGPPDASYRLRKLIRRNAVAFAAGVAVATALVIGLGLSTWMFYRERAARERAVAAEADQSRLRQLAEAARNDEAKQRAVAETARNEEARQRALADEARVNETKQRLQAELNEKKARSAAARSEQAFKFMAGMLEGVAPSVAAGRDIVLLREILDQTVRRLDTGLKDQPEVEAKLRSTLAPVYADLGDFATAEAMARQALNQSRTLHGSGHEDVAHALVATAFVCLARNRGAEAESLAREALAIYREVAGEKRAEIAGALTVLGLAQSMQSLFGEAANSLREAVTVAREKPEPDSDALDSALTSLAMVLQAGGRLAEAEPAIREALALQRKRVGEEHPAVAMSMFVLSGILDQQGRGADAEAVRQETLPIFKKTYGEEHPLMIQLLLASATFAVRAEKLAAAESLYREALTLQKKVLGAEHAEVGKTLELLARLAGRRGRPAEGETLDREAAAIAEKAPSDATMAAIRASEHEAIKAMQQRKWAQAEKATRAWLGHAPDEFSRRPALRFPAELMLADAVHNQGRRAEAETLARAAVATARAAFGDNSTHVADALLQLARSQQAQGRLTETEATLREMLAISKSFTTDGNNAKVADATLLLATIRARLGDTADASALVRAAANISRKLPNAERDNGFGFPEVWAQGLRNRGRPEEALVVERILLEFEHARDGRNSLRAAQALVRVARTLHELGRFAEAEPLAREAWALRKKLQTGVEANGSAAQGLIGQLLLGQKKYAEAEAMLLAAFGDLQKAAKNAADWIKTRQLEFAGSLMVLYEQTNRPDKAAEWRKRGMTLAAVGTSDGKSVKSAEPNLMTLAIQSNWLRQHGKFAHAEPIDRELLRRSVARDGRESANAAQRAARLAETLKKVGRHAEAEEVARECLRVREKLHEPAHWEIAVARSGVGACLLGQKRYDEAEALLLRAFKELGAADAIIPDVSRHHIADTADLLTELYAATGKPEKAAEWRKVRGK